MRQWGYTVEFGTLEREWIRLRIRFWKVDRAVHFARRIAYILGADRKSLPFESGYDKLFERESWENETHFVELRRGRR